MPARVLRVALTGGIATGKSRCLGRLAAHGVPCLDADVLARQALARGTRAFDAVLTRFGPDILTAAGDLDRGALARRVFADEGARHDLEAIVHPIVYEEIVRWFAGLDQMPEPSRPPFAVADVPLLYESGRAADFDRVVVVACRPDQQLERLMARDGLEEAEAQARIASQWPIDRKRALADVVIDTSGPPEATDRQVDDVCRMLREVRSTKYEVRSTEGEED